MQNLQMNKKIIKKPHGYSQVGWYMSVIPAFGRLRQEDYEFEASRCYIVKPCLKSKQTTNLWIWRANDPTTHLCPNVFSRQ
jgi:hypothetical protein